MAKRKAATTLHLPGMEPAPPLVDALCGVVKERFAPAAPSTTVSGSLSLHACINLAIGLEAGWPAVAYWEHIDILRCHVQLNTALAKTVGPVDAWASDPRRTRTEVLDALTAANRSLTDLAVPAKVTRRSYVARSPMTRRVLPDVAVAGVALWWSRNDKLTITEAIERIGITETDTPWEVLAKVDRRIRRTPLSEIYSLLCGDLLKRTRHAMGAGVSASPAPLLWHVAMNA
jgi:hypothetical protein